MFYYIYFSIPEASPYINVDIARYQILHAKVGKGGIIFSHICLILFRLIRDLT